MSQFLQISMVLQEIMKLFYGKIKVDFYNVVLQSHLLTEKFISCYKTVHFPSELVNYSLNSFLKPSSLCSDLQLGCEVFKLKITLNNQQACKFAFLCTPCMLMRHRSSNNIDRWNKRSWSKNADEQAFHCHLKSCLKHIATINIQ